MDEVEGHVKALGDKNIAVRLHAAEALGEIGDPRMVEPLTRVLGDESLMVRQIAARAIKRIQKK